MTANTSAASGPVEMPRKSVADTYLNPRALSFRFREARFLHIKPLIDGIIAQKGECRILDVGGTEYYWQIAGDFLKSAPVKIDLVNLESSPTLAPWCRSLIGDATKLDEIESGSYDLVHSNSVIEHVGQWRQMEAMATHIRRIAPTYYVQTPYFWFPYEPHFRMPFFHWLPEQVRFRLLMNFNLGFGGRRGNVRDAMLGLQSSSMLDLAQFRTLFPDAEIRYERVCGLTKSLMAVRASQ